MVRASSKYFPYLLPCRQRTPYVPARRQSSLGATMRCTRQISTAAAWSHAMIALVRSRQLQPRALLHTGRWGTRHASAQRWATAKHRTALDTQHPRILSAGASCRSIHIPPVLLPPVLFSGLLVALWIWKCIMLVVFQNKIIYMPGLPPNARSERIANWTSLCGGLQWAEERTVAADGTDLAMAVTTIPLPRGRGIGVAPAEKPPAAHVYVLYFQGRPSREP